MKKIITTLTAFLFLLVPLMASAITVTYFDSNFEDGSLGGGGGTSGVPANVTSSNLDGRALHFELNDQIRWIRGAAPESNLHYVGFDFWAEPDANVTQFLDVPSILRFDLSLAGRHRVDIYYDLAIQSIEVYLDNVLDNSLITIAAWPTTPISGSVRIANQQAPPGNSIAEFQIDNFIWQGNVAPPNPVPVPAAFWLFGTALVGFIGVSRRRKVA